MPVRLNGSTSGYTELNAPASAGNNTLTLPTGNGSAGNILGTDGAGNLSWVNGRMVLETVKNSTSGTNIDFTGIPSWVKRVTVAFNGVSTNGTSPPLIRLGTSSGFSTSDYSSHSSSIVSPNSVAAASELTGINIGHALTASSRTGLFTLVLITGNTWVHSGLISDANGPAIVHTAGRNSLTGALTQLRITTLNGTDSFDGGAINILYEG